HRTVHIIFALCGNTGGEDEVDFHRIGDKLVSKKRLENIIEEILELRSGGMSQTEVASRLGIDRTFVCRLESLAEVKKAARLAVVGFPIKNKQELQDMLAEEGVEMVFLLTEAERWDFVKHKSGLEIFNFIMELIARAHTFEQIIVLGSNKRIKIIEAVLDKPVVGYELGPSPLQEDVYVEPESLRQLVRAIKKV
ncbi:MAG: hypothetical protein ACOY81_09220, partial [Bacillota bacterium]